MKKRYIKKKNAIKRVRKPGVRYKKTQLLGKVTHYYDKINVAVIRLSAPLKVGDYVEFRNGDDSFGQLIESMEVNHKQIRGAKKASEIGIKAAKKVREGWLMLKAKQPSLLNGRTEQPEKKEKIEYKPIFPQSSRPVVRTTLPVPPKSIPNPVAPPPPPQPKKTGYEGIRFPKF